MQHSTRPIPLTLGFTDYPVGTVLLNPRLGTVYTVVERMPCGYALQQQYVAYNHIVIAYWPDRADSYRRIGFDYIVAGKFAASQARPAKK